MPELLNQGSFQMLTDHRNVTVKKSMLKPNLPLDKGHFITVYQPLSVLGMEGI